MKWTLRRNSRLKLWQNEQKSSTVRVKRFLQKMTIFLLWEKLKRVQVLQLEAFNQNRTKTAKYLGISIRTLRNKLNEHKGETESSGRLSKIIHERAIHDFGAALQCSLVGVLNLIKSDNRSARSTSPREIIPS